MKLFELDDTYTVNFNPEVFLIKDFAELRDSRKKNIELLYKEMAYIFFFTDLTSDFAFQTNDELRHKDVKKYVGLPDKWEPDDKLKRCIKVYDYLSQTVAGKLLKGCYIGVNKITELLENINLNERDKGGRPIWNQKQVTDTIKGVPPLLKSLKEAEAEYLKGQAENSKLRGDKIKTLYEDGFTGAFGKTD